MDEGGKRSGKAPPLAAETDGTRRTQGGWPALVRDLGTVNRGPTGPGPGSSVWQQVTRDGLVALSVLEVESHFPFWGDVVGIPWDCPRRFATGSGPEAIRPS
jgi:hypothetical protein